MAEGGSRTGALSLVQLETFRQLAREGNFTRTAELLNLTQPAITQHVRALQEHFAVKLVDRDGRRTVLTDAGAFLATRAELLLASVSALEREMREFADVRAGELRVGATITIGTYALPEIVARFHARHPAIALHVDIGNTEAMAAAVRAGRVSIALVEGPLAGDDLAIEAFASDELVLVAAPEHALTKRSRVTARDLDGLAFVSREEGSGTRTQVETLLAEAGVRPHVALALPTGEGIVRAVELNVGVAILSRLVVADALAAGKLARVPVRGLALERTFRIVRLERQTPSPAANALRTLLLAGRTRGS